MGLISRVSSRTYRRDVMEELKKLKNKLEAADGADAKVKYLKRLHKAGDKLQVDDIMASGIGKSVKRLQEAQDDTVSSWADKVRALWEGLIARNNGVVKQEAGSKRKNKEEASASPMKKKIKHEVPVKKEAKKKKKVKTEPVEEPSKKKKKAKKKKQASDGAAFDMFSVQGKTPTPTIEEPTENNSSENEYDPTQPDLNAVQVSTEQAIHELAGFEYPQVTVKHENVPEPAERAPSPPPTAYKDLSEYTMRTHGRTQVFAGRTVTRVLPLHEICKTTLLRNPDVFIRVQLPYYSEIFSLQEHVLPNLTPAVNAEQLDKMEDAIPEMVKHTNQR